MGKFDKKEACEYCEEKMSATYRSKRFCSVKCRVYWNRELKKNKPKSEEKKQQLQETPSKQELSFWEKMRNKRIGL